ncbi:unnamed protein product [Discula destructiva]
MGRPRCGTAPIIYAEYLPKLQRISILVNLSTPSDGKTKVFIGKDALTLCVFHEAVTTQMALPVPAAMQDEHLALGPENRNPINPGHTSLSWRIQPAQAVIRAAQAVASNGQEALCTPWSAADLVCSVDVACRRCHTVIICKDQIKEWKDLPSENWTEMMEFWHCHKPAAKDENIAIGDNTNSHGDNKTSNDQLASRGYGASSTISAQRGVGFVDLTKFLFHGEDLRGLLMATLPGEKDDHKTPNRKSMMVTSCLKCSTQIGHFDFRKNGFSLFKWAINFINGPTDIKHRVIPPNLAQCISAALLEIQVRDNSAKIVLQGNDKEVITVWILNPHIVFSCMSIQRVKAMKVLFRNESMAEAAAELELPDAVVLEIRTSLQRSNDFLPPTEKSTLIGPKQDRWTVGLLQRL